MADVFISYARQDQAVAKRLAKALTPEEFLRVTGSDESFTELAPMVALGLKRSGRDREADHLLMVADRIMLKHGSPVSNDGLIRLARIRAVQGRNAESLALLSKAAKAGWSPTIPLAPSDVAVDPAFALLAREPRFQQIRRGFLAHFARERTELGPVSIN